MQHLASLVLALLLGCWSVAAEAAALSVAPTRLTFGPGTTSATLTLANTGETGTVVQVETFAWRRSTAIDDLDPTREILAVPAVFNLEPGTRQVIRVALRGDRNPNIEQAYRILITEVPTEDAAEAGVRFALRLSLPVFIKPEGTAPDPRWRISREGGRPTLVLENAGNAHIHVRSLEVRGSDGETVVASFIQPAYVLPGQEHAWPIDDAALARAGGLTVKAVTNIGELNVDLSA